MSIGIIYKSIVPFVLLQLTGLLLYSVSVNHALAAGAERLAVCRESLGQRRLETRIDQGIHVDKLSFAWGLALCVFFILGVPWVIWNTAEKYDAHGWIILPILGCMYLVRVIDATGRSERWHNFLRIIEDPFCPKGEAFKPRMLLLLLTLATLVVLIGMLVFHGVVSLLAWLGGI
ncbi:hypothetical protein [Halomonas icarae]|uniref:Uncharacterized protein n=1 Tax=Halomonas icarae TaxID=2691040 RepID=A0A7X4W1S1_9GAMM|nr:hypothetical protein [Halomonas icarae]MDR5902462.1 hypothetical protein [Halomonas icarae]NAW14120.1 hypothetical protein [Halomonas icarae]